MTTTLPPQPPDDEDEAVLLLVQALVEIDTVGQREATAAELVSPWLENAGLDCHRVQLSVGRDNLIATCGHPQVTLTGHLDTVSADPSRWRTPPWSGITKDGRLFGRGTSDMKAGVAAMVVAAVRHHRRSHKCQGFEIVLTAGEEAGCLGASALVKAGHTARGRLVVIGEPTSNLPCLGHKGALWARLRAVGQAAHGSRPDLGLNAVHALAEVALELARCLPASQAGQASTPTVNVGYLHGGAAPNIVPDEADMLVDIRTTASFSSRDALALLADAVASSTIAPSGATTDLLLDLAPLATSPDDPTAVLAIDAVQSITGNRGLAAPTTYFSDGSVLATPPATAVLVGPGDAAEAHTADESCDIGRIFEAVHIYDALLTRFCGAS